MIKEPFHKPYNTRSAHLLGRFSHLSCFIHVQVVEVQYVVMVHLPTINKQSSFNFSFLLISEWKWHQHVLKIWYIHYYFKIVKINSTCTAVAHNLCILKQRTVYLNLRKKFIRLLACKHFGISVKYMYVSFHNARKKVKNKCCT